ncbi:hypothetical protein QLX67_01355 [Balneolaceae bacterium ANBcel3]|nr:hypothetical protein [Balneolaceae bacterium ANBcel3]
MTDTCRGLSDRLSIIQSKIVSCVRNPSSKVVYLIDDAYQIEMADEKVQAFKCENDIYSSFPSEHESGKELFIASKLEIDPSRVTAVPVPDYYIERLNKSVVFFSRIVKDSLAL